MKQTEQYESKSNEECSLHYNAPQTFSFYPRG